MTNTFTRRLPAEWEQYGGVLLSWPHSETDWNYMLDEVTECYIKLVEAIISDAKVIIVSPDIKLPQTHLSHLDQSRIIYTEIPTDDTWARDFGAITILNNEQPIIADFQFNGWGLKFKSCKDNLINKALINQNIISGKYENHLGFTLEGGSIESDGKGLLLTTTECLMSPNRNGDLSQSQIENYLKSFFGLKKILWLDHGYLAGDDTDSHIDTLARLAPDNTIVYVGCDNPTDEHYEALQAMKRQLSTFTTLDNTKFSLIELPLPDPIFDENGERLPATYANFLIMNNQVLMPTYNQPHNDFIATQALGKAFPCHEIITVDCRALIKQHGSLHCVTMQLPNEILQ